MRAQFSQGAYFNGLWPVLRIWNRLSQTQLCWNALPLMRLSFSIALWNLCMIYSQPSVSIEDGFWDLSRKSQGCPFSSMVPTTVYVWFIEKNCVSGPCSSNLYCSRVNYMQTFLFLWGFFSPLTALVWELTPPGSRWEGLRRWPFILWNVARGTSRIAQLIPVSVSLFGIWFLLSFCLVALLGVVLCRQLGSFQPAFISSLWDVGFQNVFLNFLEVFLNRTESFKTIISSEFFSTNTLLGCGLEEGCVWDSLFCALSGIPTVVLSRDLLGFSPVPSSISWAFVGKAQQENGSIFAVICLSPLQASQPRYVGLDHNCCDQSWPKPFLLLYMHPQRCFYFLLFLFFFLLHLSLWVWFYSYDITKTHTHTHTQRGKNYFLPPVK